MDANQVDNLTVLDGTDLPGTIVTESDLSGILRNFDFGQEQVGPDGTQQNNNDLTTLTAPSEGNGDPIIFTLQSVPPAVSSSQQYADVVSVINGFGPSDLNMAPQVADQMYSQQAQQEPWVEIIEEPKSNSLRFRYECEGKGAGALQGKSSTPEHKTFPKIKIHGFRGFATVVVSCVTHNNDPPKAHPHKLVSPASVNNGCKFGICTQRIDAETMEAEFQHLGIQCVKRKDIKTSLELRKDKKVDPFSQGWSHMESSTNIDLNAVKLCFHVWYDRNGEGKCTKPMKPVCSEVIYDAKAKKELQIIDISDTTCSVNGDKKIILLCEKVSRDDIQIWFYDNKGWEEKANFNPSNVHKQYAITFYPPKYKDLNIKEKVRVSVELRKSNESERSEPTDFYYLPQHGFSEKKLKDEIKCEEKMYNNNAMSPDQRNMHHQMVVGRPPVAMKSNPYSPPMVGGSPYSPPMVGGMGEVKTSNSPYSQVRIGQEGNPVLVNVEKNGPTASSRSISLSNIEPSLIPSCQQGNSIITNTQVLQQTNMIPSSTADGQLIYHHLQGGTAEDSIAAIAAAMSPQYDHQFSPQQQDYYTDLQPPQNGDMMYPPQSVNGGYGGGPFCINNLSSDLTNNLNIQNSPPHGLGGGEAADYLIPNASHQQKGGKRSQNDAGLDSGKLVLPYQNAKNNSGQLTAVNKHNLSRQQSSLNTPTVSEQLSDSNFLNMANLAGGEVNNF